MEKKIHDMVRRYQRVRNGMIFLICSSNIIQQNSIDQIDIMNNVQKYFLVIKQQNPAFMYSPLKLIDISNEDLNAFLRLSTFGNLQTDASLLSQQEQSLLFQLLLRLSKEKNLNVRGLWPILSLLFQNRSGLVLMTMLNNTSVNVHELITKQSFLKNIQILQNHNMNIHNLQRVLNIIGIQQSFFVGKVKQSKLLFNSAKGVKNINRNKITFLNQSNRILQQNQYDSEPDDQLYIENIYKLQQKYNRYHSVVYSRKCFQDQSDEELEDTMSIKRRIPRQIERQRQQRTVKKKPVRPKKSERKKKYEKQIQKRKGEMISFTTNRKQQYKLKNAYKLLKTIKKKQDQVGHTTIRRGPNLPTNMQQQMSEQQQISQNQQTVLVFNPWSQQEEVQQARQNRGAARQNRRISLQSELGGRRKNRKKKQIQFMVAQSEQSNQQQIIQNQFMINEQLNEQRVNLIIKKMRFPLNKNELKQFNLYQQQDAYRFCHDTWKLHIQALTRKQQSHLIKQFIINKNQIKVETIQRLISTLRSQRFRQYQLTHIKPILFHKFTLIFSQMIEQVMKILYTSSQSRDKNKYKDSKTDVIISKCRPLVLLNNDHNQWQIKIFREVICQSLLKIIQDYIQKEKETQSLVHLPRASALIKNQSKIKMQEQDFNQSIMISLFIIINQFLIKFLKIQNIDPLVVKLNKQIRLFIVQKINNKYQFLKQIYGVYHCFKLPISSNEQFKAAISYLQIINFNQVHPWQLYEIYPNLVRQFIFQKLQKDKSFNYKPMLNNLFKNQLIGNCQKTQNQRNKYLILLNYHTILEYSQFHKPFTIQRMLVQIAKTDLTDPYDIKLLEILLKVIIKCYFISLNNFNKVQSNFIKTLTLIFQNSNQNTTLQLKTLISQVKKFIKSFLTKHILFAKLDQNTNQKNQHDCQQKIRKFSQVIRLFMEYFTQNTEMQQNIVHYCITLDIFLSEVWPFFQEITSQNYRRIDLFIPVFEQLRNHIYGFQEQWKSYVNRSNNQNVQMMSEQDQIQFFFNRDKEKKKYMDIVKLIIMKNAQQLKTKLKKHEHDFRLESKFNIINELKGILICFKNLDKKEEDEIQRILDPYTKQIKLVKWEGFYKSNSKLVLQLIRGLLNAKKIIKTVYCEGGKNFYFGDKITIKILDILFLSLFSQKQARQTIQIFELWYNTSPSKNYNHILAKYPISRIVNSNQNQQYATSLEYYYKNILSNSGNKPQLSVDIINKLKKDYFVTIKQFWRQCKDKCYKNQQEIIQINIITTFTFLIRNNISLQVLNEYRSHFIMTDQVISQQNNNIIKSIEVKEVSANNSQRCIIEMFRILNQSHKSKFEQTYKHYISIVINTVFQNKSLQKLSGQIKFVKIKRIIQELNKQCIIKKLSDNSTKIDSFSYMIAQQVLKRAMDKALSLDNISIFFIQFYFRLFKNYPKLHQVYITLLKNRHEKIDKIIRITKLMGCLYLQDAIRKYVVPNNCNQQQLYSILWFRFQSNKDSEILQQLKQIIKSCLKSLNQEVILRTELVQKYQKLNQSIQQYQINSSNLRVFERYFSSNKKSNQL